MSLSLLEPFVIRTSS